jgi:hypothetical protein
MSSNKEETPTKDPNPPVRPQVQPQNAGGDRRVVPVRVPDDSMEIVRKHETLPEGFRRGK